MYVSPSGHLEVSDQKHKTSYGKFGFFCLTYCRMEGYQKQRPHGAVGWKTTDKQAPAVALKESTHLQHVKGKPQFLSCSPALWKNCWSCRHSRRSARRCWWLRSLHVVFITGRDSTWWCFHLVSLSVCHHGKNLVLDRPTKAGNATEAVLSI